MSAAIDIENVSGNAHIPDPAAMCQWIEAVLAHQDMEEAELAVRIVDTNEMTALNSSYRNKTGPTNVLSFPAELPEELNLPLLGDIVICAAVVEEEAREQHKSSAAHWAHMLVHGTLHLLGYDHIVDAEADEMEALETLILTQLGFPPPYEEQSPLA